MSNINEPKANHVNRFREPNSNVRYLKGLFFEESKDKSTVLYTLKDRDHNGYPSLYRLYMEMQDPLEINFAERYFDGWEHWQMVANATWFKPFVQRWRHELALKLRAEALNGIREIAKDSSHKGSLAANKILLDAGWQTKEEEKKVGRPTKAAIRAEADALFNSEKSMLEDLERLQ